MENARVGLFEDNPNMQSSMSDLLGSFGHNVVMIADSAAKAIEVIEEAEPNSIDVALVDADLGISQHEGAEVIKKLRERMGNIAVVGISGMYKIEDADTNIRKDKIEKIVDYINEL